MALYPNQNSLWSFEVQVCIFSRGTRSAETIVRTCKFFFIEIEIECINAQILFPLGNEPKRKQKYW